MTGKATPYTSNTHTHTYTHTHTHTPLKPLIHTPSSQDEAGKARRKARRTQRKQVAIKKEKENFTKVNVTAISIITSVPYVV